MISTYGEKYKIIRGQAFDAQLLSQAPVLAKYVVDDKDYS